MSAWRFLPAFHRRHSTKPQQPPPERTLGKAEQFEVDRAMLRGLFDGYKRRVGRGWRELVPKGVETS